MKRPMKRWFVLLLIPTLWLPGFLVAETASHDPAPAPMMAAHGSAPSVVIYPKPIATTVTLPQVDLGWMGQSIPAAVGEVTYLARRDADHWVGVGRRPNGWLLLIHDGAFQFHGVVAPLSGALTVEKGPDGEAGPEADAAASARMAVSYLQRTRMAESLFGPEPMAHADASAEYWKRLVDGNRRFVTGKVVHPNQSMARIEETAGGQHPFAVVVTCSDSRVPPEILFDQGLGDLFVIRSAGEVVTEVELGSIEYAVEHLGTTYVVVLGHERCGAVDATLKGGDLPPNIEAIAAQIRPAVQAARFFPGNVLDNAVRENAKLVLAKIKGSTLLGEAVAAGHLGLQAAYYDLDTGLVSALP